MNIKEEMPNYYKILERIENGTHSILDYVIASAFDECTYDELERAAQDLARITAENVELKRLLIEQVGEHGWINGGDYPDFCGTCENTAKQGHKADCKLAAALKQSS